MGKIYIGLNAEFSRSSDKPFEWAVKTAAEMGFQYFEPMIHFGRELMSEAGYYHTVSKCPRDIVFSVECGTPAQAAKSLEHLNRLIG